MALRVGELYATMRLDDDQFNRGLDGSKSRFEGLRSAIGTGVRAIATGFAAAATGAAGLGVAAFKVGADFNILQQNSRAALQTILGSAEAAADQMDRLDDFASNSPFARQVWITAQQQLLGFGVEAERVVPILDAVQQAVAAVGGSNEQIESVTYALATMQGTGRLTGETFNQLGQYGIDAATIIGEQMGKSGEEIRKMASKPGGIPVDQVWDPLVDGMMERFDGATEGLRQQWDGAVDRIKAAWRDIGAILAEPFIDPMGGGRAVDWANAFADTLRAAQAKIRPFVDILVDRLAPGMDRIVPAFEAAQGVINSWDVSQVNRQLDEMAKYAPLIAGVGTAMFALGTQSIPILGAINPLAAGFAALAATSPEVRTMLSEFASSLSPLLPVMGDFAVLLADTAVLTLHELTPALSDLLTAGGDLASTLGMALVPAIGDLLMAASPLVSVLADVLTWVAELPGPVQAAFLAFLAMQGPLKPVADGLQSVATGFVRIIQQARVQAVLGDTNIVMGGLASTSARASAGIGAVGTALRGAFIASGVGIAIAGITAAISAFATQQAEAKRRADEYRDSLDQVTASITDQTRELAFNNLEQAGAIEKAKDLGISLQDLVDAAVDPSSDAFDRLSEMGQRANDELNRVHEESPGNAAALKTVRDANEDLWDVLRAVGIEQSGVADGQEELRDRIAAGIGTTEEATAATDEYRRAQEELRNELNEGIDATLSAAEADLRYREAVDRTEEALRRHEEAQKDLEDVMADTNATTEEQEAAQRRVEQSSRGVEQALIQQIRQVENDLGAKARNNATTEELTEIAQQARDDYIQLARQFGASTEEAERMADQFGLIPEDLVTRFRVDGFDDAERQITRFIDRNGRRQISIKVNTTTGTRVHFPGVGGGVTMQADGGLWDGTVRAFANGGIDHAGRPVARVPQMVQGGRNILWGEPETGWESYISGKPSARARNLAVMDETARRLGGFFVRPMADGGTTGTPPRPTPVAAPVSLEGAHITGTFRLEEDGFVRIVDGRIEQQGRVARRGMRAGVGG